MCKAVLKALTNLDYAREPANPHEQRSFLDAVAGDPIATIRALIRVVSIFLVIDSQYLYVDADTGFFIAAA